MTRALFRECVIACMDGHLGGPRRLVATSVSSLDSEARSSFFGYFSGGGKTRTISPSPKKTGDRHHRTENGRGNTIRQPLAQLSRTRPGQQRGKTQTLKGGKEMWAGPA